MSRTTIINARWCIPVDSADSVLENHSIIVENGRISQILPTAEAKLASPDASQIDLSSHALIPGLINAHTHAAMSLFRGAGEDVPLHQWLNGIIWPLEGKFVDPQFVRHGTMLAAAESILSGVTCMNDMYFFPEIAGETAAQLKMRIAIGMIVLEFPTQYANSAAEYLSLGQDLHARFQNTDFVSLMLAPHAPYTVADSTFEQIRKLSEELQLRVHMHVNETTGEIEESVAQHKLRPLERLQQLNLVNSKLSAVHCVHLDEAEIAMLAEAGSSVIHCPKSNLKLANGICPVSALLNGAVNVAIGTDSAASNNSMSMIEEMRFASLLAKGASRDATSASACQTLRMATINGARAIGMDQHTGSLEVGKLADMIAIDLSDLCTEPVYNPMSAIVHSASRHQISDVWIGGAHVLKQRELQFIDADECRYLAADWNERIASHLQ